MFDCRIGVCAFLYSKQTHTLGIISSTKGLYTPLFIHVDENSSDSIKDYVYNVLDSYISTDIKKISLFLLDVEKQESLITVYYVCRLPIDSKVVNAYNIPYQQVLNHKLIQKALPYV